MFSIVTSLGHLPYAQLCRKLRQEVLPKSFVMHVKKSAYSKVCEINKLRKSES
ncbi:hypothetical protein [Desulfovulcanus sp.]